MLRFFKKLEQSITVFRHIYMSFLAVSFCLAMLYSGDANYYRRVMDSVNEQNRAIIDSYDQLAGAIGKIDHTMRMMNEQRHEDRVLYQRYFHDLMVSDSVIHNKIDYYIDSKIEYLNRKNEATDVKLDKLWYKIDSVHQRNDKWESELRRDKE